ncbi:hypothetical protein O3P69_016003 [Scylla paramamosain]|uniref:Mutator-like transposase domain-containing protein n=1 Tax=Scylla paramamosain TaxID=85552 RepID=A0AAW0T8H8_SCYPA
MKSHYDSKQTKIHEAVRKHYEEHLSKKPDAGGVLKLDVSFDATWMKRGHTSKVGMSVMIDVYTGFIIDYEILSKFCLECTLKKNKLENKKITEETYNTWKTKHDADGSCGSNYEGPSGGMEVEAARRLFARSRDLKFEYENLVSDGDANSYKAVLAMNNGNGPYQDTKVTKLECINHVQKRLGTRLRKLREQEKRPGCQKSGHAPASSTSYSHQHPLHRSSSPSTPMQKLLDTPQHPLNSILTPISSYNPLNISLTLRTSSVLIITRHI